MLNFKGNACVEAKAMGEGRSMFCSLLLRFLAVFCAQGGRLPCATAGPAAVHLRVRTWQGVRRSVA